MKDSVGMVSSVSKLFWLRSGKRMVEGYKKFVSQDIPMRIYHEASKDGYVPDPQDSRVELMDLHEVTPYAKFHEVAAPKVKQMIGIPPDDPFMRKKVAGGAYNFLWDALSFGKKGLSWAHAARTINVRWLWWIDADVVWKKPVDSRFLSQIFAGHDMVYFGRKFPYTETGLWAIDRSSPAAMKWVEAYATYWEQSKIFEVRTGWTDCQSFDEALRQVPELKKRNLSKEATAHVVPTSILGPYLEHRKGASGKNEALPV